MSFYRKTLFRKIETTVIIRSYQSPIISVVYERLAWFRDILDVVFRL